MAQAGLFHLRIPRALGGEETDPLTFVRVLEEVSKADGAVGWCLAICGGNNVFGGYLPADAAPKWACRQDLESGRTEGHA